MLVPIPKSARLLPRSMKIVPTALAMVPKTGHLAISAFATNPEGSTESSVKMSRNEMWLETTRRPFSPGVTPQACTAGFTILSIPTTFTRIPSQTTNFAAHF